MNPTMFNPKRFRGIIGLIFRISLQVSVCEGFQGIQFSRIFFIYCYYFWRIQWYGKEVHVVNIIYFWHPVNIIVIIGGNETACFINYEYDFRISNQWCFQSGSLFMLVLDREGCVVIMPSLKTRIEKSWSYSISYMFSNLKSPKYCEIGVNFIEEGQRPTRFQTTAGKAPTPPLFCLFLGEPERPLTWLT